MKLIKINTDHYIVVDNSLDFSETDYYWDDKQKEIRTGSNNHVTGGYKIKITHSTQPLIIDFITYRGTLRETKKSNLSLQEVKELIGEVDVEKRALENASICEDDWENGYNQCLEDNKEKKYTIEDVINIVDNVSKNWFRCYSHNDKKEHLSKITKKVQKTEWEVEIINGKLTLK
jgi:hypothetical protein